MSPRRIYAIAAVVGVAGGVYAGTAHSADARQAKLPSGVSKVKTIARVYPALYRRELKRKPVSWARLRRAARAEWMRTHPCATATLSRLYSTGARSSWETMTATWRCGGMPEWRVRFLSCIADHEGGRAHPDVRFGGGRGNPTGRGARNVVFGHVQGRPGWYSGARSGRPGTYGRDSWTTELYEWARHPVNQARAVAPLGPGNYATRGFCS